MDYIIRTANENEKSQVAQVFAKSFEKDFALLANGVDNVAKIFENGVNVSRVLVAEQNGKLVGAIGCGDSSNRPFHVTKKDCKKHLGFLRAFMAFAVFFEEFVKPFPRPANVGYIDFLGVLEEARGQGIAKALLAKAVEHFPQYDEFILDVTDANTTAIKLYENFGYVEYERIHSKWAKYGAGFKEKVWMRYKK